MASIFTRILAGDLPARFVYRDDRCVSFLTIAPITTGHVLVVPRAEVDHWLDLEPELASHLMLVSQRIGRALQRAFSPVKVGMMIAGLEVPHVHIHLVPIRTLADLNFANAQKSPDPAEQDRAAKTIRDALRALGDTPSE